MLDVSSGPHSEALPEIVEPFELVNLGQIVRSARMSICEAYFTGRHDAALAALAAQSIRLYRWVLNGSLRSDIAYDTLWEVADNLTLTKHYGEETIYYAIDTGPQFYSSIAGVA